MKPKDYGKDDKPSSTEARARHFDLSIVRTTQITNRSFSRDKLPIAVSKLIASSTTEVVDEHVVFVTQAVKKNVLESVKLD